MDQKRLLELARQLHGLGANRPAFLRRRIRPRALRGDRAHRGRAAGGRRGRGGRNACVATGRPRRATSRRRSTCAAPCFGPPTCKCCWCAKPRTGSGRCPAGWADVNDSPSGAIRREIEQEAGFQVRVVKLAALYDRNAHGHTPSVFHSWKAFFLCEIAGGQARGSHETDAVEFFPLDAVAADVDRALHGGAGAPHVRALAATRAADRFRLRRGFSAGFVAKLSDRFDTRNLRSARGRTRP